MRPIRKQAEMDRADIKSLALIAGAFLFANIILIVGFTSVVSAQTIQAASPALDLAKMLAAPDISVSYPFSATNMGAASAMIAGFIAMATASVFFVRNFSRDLDQASRAKL